MKIDCAPQPLFRSVTVEAPARLHLGFMDLNGSLGRRFGSLGLTIDGPATELRVAPAKTLKVTGPAHATSRALGYAAFMLDKLDLPSGLEIEIRRAIPDHVGLGSGTQMALAIASALSRLYGLELERNQIAGLTQRGKRSGIGIGAFSSGGFILDGGRGRGDLPPPVLMRSEFPQNWRILLVFDTGGRGIHGKQEVSAFDSLPEFPESSAAMLCRLVLMQALPALAECDCERFGAAIGRLQQVVGDHFAPAQSGRFASAEVSQVLDCLQERGIRGVGQSSWGPTGFAILPDERAGRELLGELRRRFAERPNLAFELTGARNHGGRIEANTAGGETAALRAAI